jgi:pertussis toxin subunit 1
MKIEILDKKMANHLLMTFIFGLLNFRKLTLILILSASSFSYAINPVSIVYRVDDRHMEAIHDARGMYPRGSGSNADYQLARHFEGESVEGRNSGLVSTTSSLEQAVRHAASLARANSQEPFDLDFKIYLYAIRPSASFYDVDASLAYARDNAPTEELRTAYAALIKEYGAMDEVVALTGFSDERIMDYVEITGERLRRDFDSGSMFSSAYWADLWTFNSTYNSQHDHDVSSSTPYRDVGTPRGYAAEVQNGTQATVLLGMTCLGATYPPSSSFLYMNVLNAKKPAEVCSGVEHLDIVNNFYLPGLFAALFN